MNGRRSQRRAPPEQTYVPGTFLDWRDGDVHWSSRALPCRYCGQPTQLRDSKRKPAHKTCAEDALAAQAAETANAYHQNGQP
ncbi:hypothetical protein ACWEQ7_04045 [Streptomyces sp. NPDC004069]